MPEDGTAERLVLWMEGDQGIGSARQTACPHSVREASPGDPVACVPE